MKFFLPLVIVALFGVACNRDNDIEREEDSQSIQREEEYDSGNIIEETPSNLPTTEEQAVGTED